MNANLHKNIRRLIGYPGLLDLIFVAALHVYFSRRGQSVAIALAIVTAIGITRYTLANCICGLYLSFSRNWYIKQAIYVVVCVAVVALYSIDQFAWVAGSYFAVLSILEIGASIRASIVTKGMK